MKANFKFTPNQIGIHQKWSIGLLRPLTDNPDFQDYIVQMAYPGIADREWKAPIALDLKLSPAVLKSEKMRMYAFYAGPLMSVAIPAFRNAGYEFVDAVLVDCEFKRMFAKVPMTKNGEPFGYYTEDKSKMTKDRLRLFINDCIIFLEAVMGVQNIPNSKDYLTNKGRGTNFKSVKS
jgi:hypothetical protein